MKFKKPESRGTERRPGPPGFTLVELLVVISIIMLLAMLLMPTIQMVIEQFYAGRSAMLVKRLHDGAIFYKLKNKFLPGEGPDPKVPGGSGDPRTAMTNGTLTGSQVLAACLFNIEYDNMSGGNKVDFSDPVNKNRIDASKVYAKFESKYFIDYADKINSLSDGFPKDKAKPICYFLASNNPIHRNKTSQFRFADNSSYMLEQASQPPLNQAALETWLNRRLPTTTRVLNNGSFLLIAPGLNRNYLVDDEDADYPGQMMRNDDITNDYGQKRP